MKKQGFIFSSFILLGMVFVTKILGLIYKIPLTNILGGTGYGYISVAYSVFMPIFSIAVSGITTSVAKLVSENVAFERYKNAKKIRKTALTFFFVSGSILTLVCIALAYPICRYIVHSEGALWSVIAISPCILIGCILAVERGFYEGLRNMTPTAVTEIIESLFKIIAGLGLAVWASRNSDRFFIKGLPFVASMSVLGVSIANFISLLVMGIFKVSCRKAFTKEMLLKDSYTQPFREILGEILKISIPIAVAFCISTIGGLIDAVSITACLDRALEKNPEFFTQKIGPGIDISEIPNFIYGSYTGLALTVFGLVPSITSIFGKSILPIISEDFAKGQKVRISQKLSTLMLITSVIAFPSAMGIYNFSEEILQILFPLKSEEIVVCLDGLKILCFGMIFLCVANPLFAIIQAISKPFVSIKIMLYTSITRLILNVILVSNARFNIAGASISTSFCYILIFLMSVYELSKLIDFKFSIRKVFVIPFFASYFCVNLSKFIYHLLENYLSSLFCLGISVILAVILYIFSLNSLCSLTKNQVKSLILKNF